MAKPRKYNNIFSSCVPVFLLGFKKKGGRGEEGRGGGRGGRVGREGEEGG